MNAQPKQNKPILKLTPKAESKKVCADDGFTAIPNELLFAMGRFGFTQRQFNVLIAVIQKTLAWHKEMDWIGNSQLCELVDLPDEQKASKTKQELVRMKVLRQEGNKIGLNLVISEWKKDDCTKRANTKETITKEKINRVTNVTLSSADDVEAQAVDFAEQSAKPKKTKSPAINYQGVVDLYNEANEETGSRLPSAVALNDDRKRAIKKFLAALKEPTLEMAGKYFRVFFASARPHHFGENASGWKASFDFAIREKVVIRVREGNL